MTILFRVLLSLLLGVAEIGALEGITRGIAYIHQKTKAGIIPAWQVWIFIGAVAVVLMIRRLQPITWIMEKIRERWHFHLVLFLVWVSVSSSYFHWGIPLGLDLKGGSELLYRVRYENLPAEERPGVTQRTINILERRLNPQGTRELRIQQQGAHRILIQLPGADVAQTQRDKDRIQRAGRLEFRLVDTDPSHIDAAKQAKRVAGVTPFVQGEKERYYRKSFSDLKDKALDFSVEGNARLILNRSYFTGKQLASAYPTMEDVTPAVGFQFKGGAKRHFARFTEQNVGKRLAIVLDNVMYSDPVIKERIFGAGRISGKFTQEEVNNLVIVLRAGSLPADVELEMENHVGPTLGEDSIRKSILAILIAMAIVLGFMAVYYLAAGCVADFALMLNLLLVLGAMSTLNATLTLPGIAGLILTVGMAVDANVLIYERIREEKERILQRRSKGEGGASPEEEREIVRGSLRDIIRKGYDLAFRTIVDANVTTLITAIILYLVGTGPIKGFAVTLSLGIITSMFTALFVTRSIFEYAREHGWLTDLKMNSLIGRTSISFSSIRMVMFALSLVVIIAGLTVFAQRGARKYDIDFTGGTRLLLQLSRPMPIGEARKRVAEAGYPRAEVQSLWSEGTTEATGTDQFNIRIPAGSLENERIEDIFRKDMGAICGGQENVQKIAFTPPLTVEVTITEPLSETDMRAGLVARGYPESIIGEVVSADAKSSKFVVDMKAALSEQDQKGAREALADRLDDVLLRRQVTYTLGRLREVSATDEEAAGHRIEINLSRTVSTEMVEKEMEKLGFEKITAVARGGLRGSGVAKRAFLRGSEATLKKIREKGDGTFEVVAFNFSQEGGIEMELKEAMTEGDLRAKLGPVAQSLHSIIPLDASGKEYRIVLKELGDTKVRKHIGDDLTQAFGDCVVLEKIGVKFGPAELPADLKEKKEEEAEQFDFVTMELDEPQPFSVVKERIMKAGALSCLVDTPSGETGGEEDVKQVLLKFPKGETESRQKRIAEAFEVPDPFKLVVGIGATVAGEMKDRAFLALIFALSAIIFYVWFRFGELKFGIAAVVALAHDVTIALGALAVGDMIGSTAIGQALLIGDIKISLPVVAAFLTIIGYSLNDTIVVFDRIRENLAQRHTMIVDAEVIDLSVNQTLSRTLLTSLTTLVVVVSLYLMGGSVIHGFAYTLIIGVVVGTYSSIFIASPLLIEWDRFRKRSQ